MSFRNRVMTKSIETKLIHAGEPNPRVAGAVAMPIFQSAMFEYAGPEDEVRYIRYSNNPNQLVLQEKLAALENAEDAIVTSSGMAAISSALLAVLQPGDHLLAQKCLYGGTHKLVTTLLAELGIDVGFIDASDPASWEHALKPQTKAIYVETVTNPLVEVGDLGGVAEFARSHGLMSLIDNTFASPINFRPSEWGFDISIHSATKYLNGHSDIVAGVAIGTTDIISRIRHRVTQLGGSLDPHACYLVHRGLKTLALRVKRQNQSAAALAQELEDHPAVSKVNYPGLASSPSYARASKYLDGFGGMLSFDIEESESVVTSFMRSLEIPVPAPSLGSVETLIVQPAQTSHVSLSPEEREAAGVNDGLIRVSVGIESVSDLIADFVQALNKIPHTAAV